MTSVHVSPPSSESVSPRYIDALSSRQYSQMRLSSSVYHVASPFYEPDIATEGLRLYRTDLATRVTTDLGQVSGNGRGVAFYLFVDNRGDCWLTIGRGPGGTGSGNDNLYVARAGTSTIDAFPGALPTMKRWDANVASANQNDNWWHWGQPRGDGERFIFTIKNNHEFGGSLWEFDASRAQDGDLSDAFREIAWIGGNDLALAVGADRVYYATAGKSYVLKAGPKFELLGEGDLGDNNPASPAVADGRLFLKGAKFLWCVGENAK